jgi:hypothetical protein|tara:strand:- start:797 stop:1366 length:570 start_codon:yes stop_codon:yes gene_type:complete
MPLEETDYISESTPEGRAQAVMPQVQPVIDEAALAIDETVGAAAPIGRFTAKRQNALAKVLNKILKEVGSDVSFEETYTDIKDAPLPDTLVRGLLGVKGAVDTFATVEPEEVDVTFEISEIVSDSELAFVTAQLDTLFKNKRFVKFLREEEPVVQLAPEEAVVEEPVVEEEIIEEPIEPGSELDILASL